MDWFMSTVRHSVSIETYEKLCKLTYVRVKGSVFYFIIIPTNVFSFIFSVITPWPQGIRVIIGRRVAKKTALATVGENEESEEEELQPELKVPVPRGKRIIKKTPLATIEEYEASCSLSAQDRTVSTAGSHMSSCRRSRIPCTGPGSPHITGTGQVVLQEAEPYIGPDPESHDQERTYCRKRDTIAEQESVCALSRHPAAFLRPQLPSFISL
ncbi:uncharacterized protein LOC142493767 isoform X1 [Ascaphus truei]|uniref:uncharacterized protein LOC142493767 isoform X1 n=1 Tax=Ascaphus truei TaxID=8439 RepID=UPI003F5AC64C